MQNTRFSYMYRDGANYKNHDHIILSGILSESEINSLFEYQDEGTWFLPKQVGLNPLYFDNYILEIDHDWHEITSIDPTDEPPTTSMSIHDLLMAFQKADKEGWNLFKYGRN